MSEIDVEWIADAGPRRERRIALGLGLPWGWRVHTRSGALVATGPSPLPCGHKSVSAVITDGDVLLAASRLAMWIDQHMAGG